MIGTVISFLVFVIVVVILYLILQWGMTKLGITIDPALRTIIMLIVFLIMLVMFLNWAGIWTSNGNIFHSR
jgi:hypothetical protein